MEGNECKDQGSSDRSIDLATVVSGTIDYYLPEGTCVFGDDVIRKNKVSSVGVDYDNNAITVATVQAIAKPEDAFVLTKGEEKIPVTVTSVGSKYSLTLPEGKTLDLAELHLDTGRALVYKWGAAPSWLITGRGSEKIGTVVPPPGLSVTEDPEEALRLSLRGGEVLAMLSDGVGGEDALRCQVADGNEPLAELAKRVLESRVLPGADDATVALIRLHSLA